MQYPGSTEYLNRIIKWFKDFSTFAYPVLVLGQETGKTEIWSEDQMRTSVKPWVLFPCADQHLLGKIRHWSKGYGVLLVCGEYIGHHPQDYQPVTYQLQFNTVHAMDSMAEEINKGEADDSPE